MPNRLGDSSIEQAEPSPAIDEQKFEFPISNFQIYRQGCKEDALPFCFPEQEALFHHRRRGVRRKSAEGRVASVELTCRLTLRLIDTIRLATEKFARAIAMQRSKSRIELSTTSPDYRFMNQLAPE
jgi:hypothetical protein